MEQLLDRRAEDTATKIRVTDNLRSRSSELEAVRRELKKGHSVLISPAVSTAKTVSAARAVTRVKAGVKAVKPTVEVREIASRRKMSGTDIVTALSGGAALGIAALAVAPASALFAAVATIAGVALGGVARKLD